MNTATDLARRIMAALEFERRINLHRFPLRVLSSGEMLVLDGHAENVAAKRLAICIARALAGAEVTVIDALDVTPAPSMADGDMLEAFTHALLESPELKPITLRRHHRNELQMVRLGTDEGALGAIEFAISEGVVELTGRVPSLSHRRVVEALAWWLPGCRNVINGLRVDPPQQDGDRELADAVGLVLEIDPSLPESQPIGVDVTFGVVTLRGALHNAAQRRRAEHDAWCVEGVREVRNAIEVTE